LGTGNLGQAFVTKTGASSKPEDFIMENGKHNCDVGNDSLRNARNIDKREN
jgi:hypothetical protein